MKQFPKKVFVWLNGNGNPVATLYLDQIPPGGHVGVYELRAIKVVKRETVLEDPPPPDFPEQCPEREGCAGDMESEVTA